MEPYNPNKPFVQMKLEGNLLDRLAEAGIPLTRALQYFRDNPEGPASETLNLATDETVPFKYQIRSGDASPSSIVQEALMLAAPTPKGSRKVVPDITETKMFNDKLRQIATSERNNGNNYVADKLDDWSNRNLTLDDYNTFENWNNPEYYDNVPSLVNDKYLNSKLNDIILTEGDMNNPLLDRGTVGAVVDKYNTPMRSSYAFADKGPSGFERDYDNRPHIVKAIESYEKQGYGIDKMAQDLVDYYTYDKYPIDMSSKPSSYAFTIGDLEMNRIPHKSDLLRDVESLLGNPDKSFGTIDAYARNFGKSYPVVKDIFGRLNNALADPAMSRGDKYIAVKSALEELAIEEGLKGI